MQKTTKKIIGIILIGILTIIFSLIFFTRHLEPTPNKPTIETLSLAPNNSNVLNQSESTSTNSAPITSIPAAEAWVLNLNTQKTN